MAYTFSYPWRKNPRLMALFYAGAVCVEEINDSLQEAQSLLDRAQMPLHLLIDFSEVVEIDLAVRDAIIGHSFKNHDRLGYCVFTKPNAFLHFVAQVLRKHDVQIKYVEDLEDAWGFFNHMGLC